ncbi:UPF0158 family protein [Cupriavidus nantongensis]|uniref:UPF0158 family protein n=1 Tax=Cupriavidus nantongensis TaxID=1796606 RepID=UPI002246D643|nr:UPF0158 family protein [Cupriavidus nantongensis]
MVAIKFDDLSMAFDFVSAGAPYENNAYVSIDTGKFYWTSNVNDVVEEEVPDDLEASDRYLAIPHQTELGLGKHLTLEFVEDKLPECYEHVEGYFRRKGAYARFKGLLERKGILELWYAFEAEAVERALRQWCAENGLEVVAS